MFTQNTRISIPTQIHVYTTFVCKTKDLNIVTLPGKTEKKNKVKIYDILKSGKSGSACRPYIKYKY